jgi:thioredoxin-dependent peroxiredoxin
MKLKVGDIAPDFTAPDQDGNLQPLSSTRGKTLVLYFYPKDETPGCTKEACNFRDSFQRIAAKGVTVWGVSVDSVASHKKFHEKYQLNFTLISDADRKISQAYDVLKSLLVTSLDSRTTFLIDKGGVIRYIWESVQVAGHVDEILGKIDELGL